MIGEANEIRKRITSAKRKKRAFGPKGDHSTQLGYILQYDNYYKDDYKTQYYIILLGK